MGRIITVVVVALVMAAMILAMAMPAFAQGPWGSENSCGASNPNIGEHPPNRENKEASGEFEDCGFRNNPHISGIPPGQEN